MATSEKRMDLDVEDAREALNLLSRCMVWQETPQGHDFWQSAYDALFQLVLEHGGSSAQETEVIAKYECAYCQRKYATAEVRNDHQDQCDPRNALNR